MLMYKHPEWWEAAKQITKAKHEAKQFNGIKDLKQYVKDNKQYIPDIVESGVSLGYSIKI